MIERRRCRPFAEPLRRNCEPPRFCQRECVDTLFRFTALPLHTAPPLHRSAALWLRGENLDGTREHSRLAWRDSPDADDMTPNFFPSVVADRHDDGILPRLAGGWMPDRTLDAKWRE